MGREEVLTRLLAELRRRASRQGDPDAYLSGVRDALCAVDDLLGAGWVPPPPADGILHLVEDPAHLSRADLDEAASWLAGYAIGQAQQREPTSTDVAQAIRLSRGSTAAVDRAVARVQDSHEVDAAVRERALQLLGRCRTLLTIDPVIGTGTAS